MTPIAALLENCRKYADRPALVIAGRTILYGELREAVVAQSRRLAADMAPGERLALLCANTFEFITLSLAAEAAGIIRVPLNIKCTPAEIAVMLADCEPALIVYEDDTRRLLSPAHLPRSVSAAKLCRVKSVGVVTSPQAGDRCSITYTSGSTGKPKGVVLSHANWHYVFANMLIDRDIAQDDTLAFIGPLTHASWSYLYAGLLRGAQAAVFASGDVTAMLAYAARDRVTITTCVPTTLSRIVSLTDDKHPLRSSLKWVAVGGAPTSPALLARAMSVFGRRIVLNFGQTEAMMTCSFYDLRREIDRDDAAGFIGRPYVFSDLCIMDSEGRSLPVGEIGEICVRGPHTLMEYWRQAGLTAAARRDGYVLTGDLGVEAQPGLFRIVGRAKDMIITGGFNVYPLEVETAVAALDGIDEVSVIGLPSEEWGEKIACFFSTTDGAPRDLEALRAVLKPVLGIKTPKEFHQLAALPKAPTGKIDKKALKAGLEGTS